ncbi:MAG: DUF1592 domain-containing protein [Bacteroidota bacterium]
MKFRTIPFLLLVLSNAIIPESKAEDRPREKHYQRTVRPIMRKHCNSCHNQEDKKGGLNLEKYDFTFGIVRDGELFTRVVEMVEEESMPPDFRPRLQQEEIDTLSFYLNKYIEDALAEKDPGLIPPRKLNNREYRYCVEDLFGIKINTDSLFPSEASGGSGFDNQARVLYLTPLQMERYYEAAEIIVEELYADSAKWEQFVPTYKVPLRESIRVWWNKWWNKNDLSLAYPMKKAKESLIPLATKAYRKFLNSEEQRQLLDFFKQVYLASESKEKAFEGALKETFKVILLSQNFLYRQESDPDIKGAYPITSFEMVSRLSFFLWSSMPDQELLERAYREDLQDPEILNQEVERMLLDPKAHRMGESFALNWFELNKMKAPDFQVDPDTYPEFTPVLRDLMLKEVELFFNHVLGESQNFTDLISSDYTYLNKELAAHYGIKGIEGEEFQMNCLEENSRGGVLGMAGILTATSLPVRTSPVLRGKWVLEQLLGTPAPPPPPNVPELEASQHEGVDELSLRELLLQHREDPACKSCHLQMDPLGLGLENFDAIGRWRDTYARHPIDASGKLASGEVFQGPAELKQILMNKKELFAKNLSKKMLSFALGRSLQFKDTPTIRHLSKHLLEHDFHTISFIQEVVKSYPFTHKKSDRPLEEMYSS